MDWKDELAKFLQALTGLAKEIAEAVREEKERQRPPKDAQRRM